QTETGKESSNLFMAGSLPKTILYYFLHKICVHVSPFEFPFVYLVVTSIDSPLLGVNTPRSDEDRLKLMELMVFLMTKDVCDEIGLNAARLSKLLLSGKYKPLLKDSDGEDVDVHTYSQENLLILEEKALLGLMVSKEFTL
nr:hypothetical protein [Tanacetum cinerariifolium]